MPGSDPERQFGGRLWYGEQDENGVDVSLIRENLKLTPEERLRRSDLGADDALRRRAGEAPSKLRAVVTVLRRHAAEFTVVGGYAEALQGSLHDPVDLDLCYDRTHANLEAIAASLRALEAVPRGAPRNLRFIADARTLALGTNFTFSTTAGPLDLLGWVEPLGDYAELAKNARAIRVADLELKVIALDDLIRIKEHISRPKDRESLLQLRAIKRLQNER